MPSLAITAGEEFHLALRTLLRAMPEQLDISEKMQAFLKQMNHPCVRLISFVQGEAC